MRGKGAIFDFLTNLIESLAEVTHERVIGARDQPMLGLDQAGEAGCGQAKDAQDAGSLVEVGGVAALLDEAADVDAQHGDLVFEAVEIAIFQPGKLGLFEMAGVEAMLEGVEVAGRSAAAGRDFRLWIGHGGIRRSGN